MASSSVVVLRAATPAGGSPSKKRLVTPSAEESSSKRPVVLITPGKTTHASGEDIFLDPSYTPRQLSPSGKARVTDECTSEELVWSARRILLPFNLRDTEVDVLAPPVCDLLAKAFPGITGITEGRYRAYLHFSVNQLPPTPWPLTIGGVAVTIGTQTSGRGPLFPHYNPGNLSIALCEDLDGTKADFLRTDAAFRQFAARVCSEFNVQGFNVGDLVEILYTCERNFYLVVADHIDLKSLRRVLPGKIARCWAMYVLDKEIARPKRWNDLKAKRLITPQPNLGIVDMTAYEILRPGVIINSSALRDHGHPAHFPSTSGVLVKNFAGDKFMTVASHAVGDDLTMFQKLPSGQFKRVGTAVHEITFTGVSIVRLEDDIQFENQTFENISGTTPVFTRLVGELDNDTTDYPAEVYLNSPYTGNMEGQIVARSVKLEQDSAVSSIEKRMRYVVYAWIYTGQVEGAGEKAKPPDGTCGFVIWDDRGVIQGFFRYYVAEGKWAGFSVSVSASEVVLANYTLA